MFPIESGVFQASHVTHRVKILRVHGALLDSGSSPRKQLPWLVGWNPIRTENADDLGCQWHWLQHSTSIFLIFVGVILILIPWEMLARRAIPWRRDGFWVAASGKLKTASFFTKHAATDVNVPLLALQMPKRCVFLCFFFSGEVNKNKINSQFGLVWQVNLEMWINTHTHTISPDLSRSHVRMFTTNYGFLSIIVEYVDRQGHLHSNFLSWKEGHLQEAMAFNILQEPNQSLFSGKIWFWPLGTIRNH